MNISRAKSIIESILFIWGEPIELKELSKLIEIDEKQLLAIIKEMKTEYEEENRGLIIKNFDGFYQMKTKDCNYEYIAKLFTPKNKSNLSNAALEALSIIAYRQPVSKIEIDQIRGVKSDHIIKSLLDKDLTYISGKLDKPGRPLLYSTTTKFLSVFGLESIKALPKYIEASGYKIYAESEEENEIE